MKPCRILIADDHDVVRKGLRAILELHPGWTVCSEVSTGRQAVETAVRDRPDLVIMDINMPELNGLDATRQIVDSMPQLPVLILSAHDSELLVRQMVSSGARGYVLKSDAGEDLAAAVEALTQGRLFFTSTVSQIIMRDLQRPPGQDDLNLPPAPRLSGREREVLQLLAEGRTNKEVAITLGISVKTVETHRSNLMSKLDLHSISDLVRYAIQNEIIRP